MVVYLGVVPTALAFTTWAYALTRTSAGKMGATTYVVPAIVVLMSWAFLGETPRPLAYLGGALCLGGVAVSRGHARLASPASPAGVTAGMTTRSTADGGAVHGAHPEAGGLPFMKSPKARTQFVVTDVARRS